MRFFNKPCHQLDSIINKFYLFLLSFTKAESSENQNRLNEILSITLFPTVLGELIISYDSENPSFIHNTQLYCHKSARIAELDILKKDRDILISSENYAYQIPNFSIYNHDHQMRLRELNERIEEIEYNSNYNQ